MYLIPICAAIGLIWGTLPWTFGIIQCLVNYWTRSDSNKLTHLGVKLSTFGVFNDYDEEPEEDQWMTLILAAGWSFVYAILGVGVGRLILSGYLWHTLISIGVLIAIIYLPRLLFDTAKALKYNRKTGNAERIDKLEAELAQLKSK